MVFEASVKFIFICCILLFCNKLRSQELTHFSIQNSTLGAPKEHLPFWFYANQHGKIEGDNAFLNITDVGINHNSVVADNTTLGWKAGCNLIAAIGNTSYWQLNRLYGAVSLKGWELKAGMFYDPIHYDGLSTTNGNLIRSGNARPYPNISLSNTSYKPVPFLDSWLNFKIEYDEGLLNDNRYVESTHLHHKSLYLLITPGQSWDIQIGLEHFVMWGGTSKDEEIGELPKSFNNYLRYIFALPGNEDFPENGQLNKSGNHLGTYQFKFRQRLSNANLSFYLSHPFENHPGMQWKNWQDNLLGVYLNFKSKHNFITNILYEFTNTRHQNINDSLYVFNEETNEWRQYLYEDYFNHLLFKTGFTYHEKVLGSPLFFPIEQYNDDSGTNWYAIRSTRFLSHHFGISGNLTSNIKWKGLFTYVQHLGTYKSPYDTPQKQISSYFEIQYAKTEFPFETILSFAADNGNSISNKFGIQISLLRSW